MVKLLAYDACSTCYGFILHSRSAVLTISMRFLVRSAWFIGLCYIDVLPMISIYDKLPICATSACITWSCLQPWYRVRYHVSIHGTFDAWYQSMLQSMHAPILLKSINKLYYRSRSILRHLDRFRSLFLQGFSIWHVWKREKEEREIERERERPILSASVRSHRAIPASYDEWRCYRPIRHVTIDIPSSCLLRCYQSTRKRREQIKLLCYWSLYIQCRLLINSDSKSIIHVVQTIDSCCMLSMASIYDTWCILFILSIHDVFCICHQSMIHVIECWY